VYVLTDVRLDGEPVGVAFAFANAGLFALYIVLAHRVSRSTAVSRLDGLAAAMLVATVAITPIGGSSAAPAFLDPVALCAGLGVGLASSVVPYVLDQLAMARLSRATYSLLVSLLPATATVIGVVVLAQIPSTLEVLGVALVVAAVAVHREEAPERAAADAGGLPRFSSPIRGMGFDGRGCNFCASNGNSGRSDAVLPSAGAGASGDVPPIH
jgi:inner membrane transporter RhtA